MFRAYFNFFVDTRFSPRIKTIILAKKILAKKINFFHAENEMMNF